jgi:hypothetical protein
MHRYAAATAATVAASCFRRLFSSARLISDSSNQPSIIFRIGIHQMVAKQDVVFGEVVAGWSEAHALQLHTSVIE